MKKKKKNFGWWMLVISLEWTFCWFFFFFSPSAWSLRTFPLFSKEQNPWVWENISRFGKGFSVCHSEENVLVLFCVWRPAETFNLAAGSPDLEQPTVLLHEEDSQCKETYLGLFNKQPLVIRFTNKCLPFTPWKYLGGVSVSILESDDVVSI